MGRTDVHRCKFTSWRPSEITAIAKNVEKDIVAVGRADNSIELWSIQGNFHLLNRLGGSKFQDKIIGLEWYLFEGRYRLISITSTQITQWDLETMESIQQVNSVGGSITAYSFNKRTNMLACGAGSLTVYLYTIDQHKNGSIVYQHSLPKIMGNGSIECMQWSVDNNHHLVVSTDLLLLSFNVEKSERLMEVNCSSTTAMCIIDHDTVALGHSTGIVSFHELKYGTTIQEIKHHIGAIRTIEKSNYNQSNLLFLAGDDPTIVCLLNNSDKWSLSGLHRPHTHDVRCIEVFDDFIISGGVTTVLSMMDIASFATNNNAKKSYHYSYPLNNIAMTDKIIEEGEDGNGHGNDQNLILEASRNEISIWKLGNHSTDEAAAEQLPSGTHLVIDQRAKRLALFKIKELDYIRSVDISYNGKYFAYSTASSVNIYSLEEGNGDQEEEGGVSIHRLKSFKKGSDLIKFTRGTKQPLLVITSNNSKLLVYDLIEDEIVQKIKSTSSLSRNLKILQTNNNNISNKQQQQQQQQQQEKEKEKEKEEKEKEPKSTTSSKSLQKERKSILHLAIDSTGNYAATVDSKYNICFFNLSKGICSITIPNHLHVGAIAFHPTEPILYIANSEEIVVFNARLLKTVHMSPAPKGEAVIAITNNPSDSNRMILWGHNTIFVTDWSKPREFESKAIFPELVTACSSLLYNQLVTIELPYHEQVLPHLPSAIKLKLFGKN